MSAQMSDSPHTTAPPVAGPASRYTAAWTTAQTPARGDAVGHGVAGSICDTPFGLRPRRGGARPCVHGQPGGVAVLTGWAARPARRRRPPAGARVWHTRAGGARIFPHVGWPRDGPSPAWSGTRSEGVTWPSPSASDGERGRIMRRMISGGLVAAGLLLAVGPATAQDLVQLQNDPNQWVLPGKNYAGTRFSELDQINTQNVKDLKVAWTFSTGTLNGLEGAPLVVNNTMYFVTSFPNIVYALDLT